MDSCNSSRLLYNQQIQYNMSQTYQPKKRKRARVHGFLTRQRTPGGKNIIRRRRRKGRTALSA